MQIGDPMNNVAPQSISAEAKRHWAEFLVAYKIWRGQKMPIATKIFLFVALLALMMGWIVGVTKGTVDGLRMAMDSSNAVYSRIVENNANGREYITHSVFANAADHAVRFYVYSSPPTLTKQMWELTSLTYWFDRGKEDSKRSNLVRMAETRLKYLPPPSAETLEQLTRLNRDYLPSKLSNDYEYTARAYSTLLGRTITGAQLVSDAKLRADIADLPRQQN